MTGGLLELELSLRGGDLAALAGSATPLSDDEAIDALQVRMMEMPEAELPVTHRFTPGLYIREIFRPAGALVTSKVHRTQHPFTISKGSCDVWVDGAWVHLRAPHTGITMPGTRRVLRIYEDTVWTTYHPTDLTDVDAIEAAIIEPRYEHLKGLRQPTAREIIGRKQGALS